MTARLLRHRLSAILVGTIVALMLVEAGLRGGARWIFIDRVIQPDADLGWVLLPASGTWAMDENPGWVTINSTG